MPREASLLRIEDEVVMRSRSRMIPRIEQGSITKWRTGGWRDHVGVRGSYWALELVELVP